MSVLFSSSVQFLRAADLICGARDGRSPVLPLPPGCARGRCQRAVTDPQTASQAG